MEEKLLYELADLFKVFGDSTRISILDSLYDSEKSVTEMAEALNMNQSAISHQLKILKSNKLVKSRREGKQIFYSLDDEHVQAIMKMGKKHLLEAKDDKNRNR